MPRTYQRCKITHAQILFGVCPWCDVIIGKVRSEMPLRKALTQWYPAAVAEGIRSDDPTVRDTTVSGLWHGWQLDDEMLGVLSTALHHADRSLVDATERVTQLGASRMDDAKAEMLEMRCDGGPIELPARIMLLAFHSIGTSTRSDTNRTSAHARHTLWMIEHAPQCSILRFVGSSITDVEDSATRGAAKELWDHHLLKLTHDGRILKNAALFFFHDEPERALRLLRQGIEIDPEAETKFLLKSLEEIRNRRCSFTEPTAFNYWKVWKRDF